MHNSIWDGRCDDAVANDLFEGPLSAPLLTFAEKHSLTIKKYLHGVAIWQFCFLHPMEGRGVIQLTAATHPDAQIQLATAGFWYVDDEVRLQRSSYGVPLERLSTTDPEETVAALESVLDRLLRARPSQRTKLSPITGHPRDENGALLVGPFERALRIAT